MMDINTGKALDVDASLDQSIKLIIFTIKGERVLNRSFGSNVINYLDSPINLVAIDITAELTTSIEQTDNRISIDKVSYSEKEGRILAAIYYNQNNEANIELS